jgi:hypothetical protein
MCFVASQYAEVFRAGTMWPGTPLGDAGPDITVEDLLAAVPQYAVQDLIAMARRAEGVLGPLRAAVSPHDVVCGPTFDGSIDAGGADADWIAGGLLIEAKATCMPQKLPSIQVWQLAGYVLLDYTDQHRISSVGWYQARLGWLVTWELQEFFTLLGATHSVPQLRSAVRKLLAPTPPPRPRRTRAARPPSRTER